ncbi:GFA family protein [Mesorhizobium sp. M4B.F.Ca.ET.215.01.1.1]|uniref:GFA family protein n=1 Tax=Mesorhizobium abyssinicae TaxID=1209958 RepID=A0ABU5APF4_9HYPH|nr:MULTISPECIES: GFA family protein [Mesorhizobium]MDX8539168.1 GFA family protein [Mesorhizobium abyssinicae]RUW26010.1 GFA family protein [Mesorhizobium sp. M4B.F.Ca.ET.013.02.1.1]RVD39834.1 GFA family protein [Mesorhizobium sp. M4B.F.Ca.ET.019.03.1.1]RWF62755.1 MAG: GFA family protein [Mesorhizobium sp.]TGQ18743.1 GFA family protein [Mesorhizobium sp. M4B.F.Ca.ET.215.01.1.1]
MTSRTASCACGQLQIRCPQEPDIVSLCHCLDCQRRTGSPFGIAAFFDAAATDVTGLSRTFERNSDSGFSIAFHFCGSCGSTVFWYPSRRPAAVAVAVGCFADPSFPAPTRSVFDKRRHGWVAVPA